MTTEKIPLQQPLENILEEYYILYNGECDYYYGIIHLDEIMFLKENYDIEDHFDELIIDPLIPYEVFPDLETETISEEKIRTITKNLGIKTEK